MTKQELRSLIKEEITRILKEAVSIDPALKNELKVALATRKRDPEDDSAHDFLEYTLRKIYKKAGRKDANKLASDNMKDEVTMTGPLSAVISLINDTLSDANAETFTFSGVKSFMSFKAIPVFKKHGIDVTKIKKSYDPDSGTTEITTSMDAKTAEKIGRELEKLDTVGERFGGYIQESGQE